MTLEDLLELDRRGLHGVLEQGHPLDLDALTDQQYLGVDLSLPTSMQRMLWRTFRKTFHLDSGILRGWNVRMEQLPIRGPQVPLRDRDGVESTFGHYQVCDATDQTWPKRWRGAHYLDYRLGRNRRRDPARIGHTPLVAVNDDMSLLLGWEVVRIAGVKLGLPLYWALEHQGPLDRVVPPPR